MFDEPHRRENQDGNQEEPQRPRAPHHPAHAVHHLIGARHTVRCVTSRSATAQASRIGCCGSGRGGRVCPRRGFAGSRRGLARTSPMISTHHAQTKRTHNQTGCRRHDQWCDSDTSEPIPTNRETGGGDSQPSDGEDTTIPDPGSEHACATIRLHDLNALHPFTPSAHHVKRSADLTRALRGSGRCRAANTKGSSIHRSVSRPPFRRRSRRPRSAATGQPDQKLSGASSGSR